MTPPVVSVVGGGQLARMMAIAAAPLGIQVRLLADTATDCATRVIPDSVVGDCRDLGTLRDFVKLGDVLTFDYEHVPTDHLAELEAGGIAVRPGADALIHAQDKGLMRQRLSDLGLPVPRWRPAETLAEVEALAADTGWPVILKTTRGGYDGKGVWHVSSPAEADAVLTEAAARGTSVLAEECVPFRRELAAQVARRPSGEVRAYPVVETLQQNGICREVVAPARVAPEVAAEAERIAVRIATELDVTGMLAVELFETADGRVLINELAMRPHNSGHWSIEGAGVSQFEQHLRAVLDLPLGDPLPRAPYAVMVNVLGGARADLATGYAPVWQADPGVHVHLYGKDVKPGRKVGHVTVLGENPEALLARGRAAVAVLEGSA